MKKAATPLLALLLCAALLALAACGDLNKPASSGLQDGTSSPGTAGSGASSETDLTPDGPCVTVTFDCGTEDTQTSVKVAVGGQVPKPEVVREGYVLRRWLKDGKEYDFSTPVSEDLTLSAEWLERTVLPATVVELRDENGREYDIEKVDRENYVTATVSVINAAGSYEVLDAPAGFRGRGNGSWGDAKKCFKIRFDEKQPLFGRAENRHWVLLACTNFNDGTLLRNYTAYNLAGLLFDGLEYVTNAVWTDLYVNGEYRGVYVLCEHVRVGEGRVDIDSDYAVEDTGYLIEYDSYASGVEGIDYFSINETSGDGSKGQTSKGGAADGMVKYNFTVHSPDPDGISEKKVTEEEYRAQVAYIKDYVTRVYTAAIVDHDFETLSELVDLDSLVDIYILHELYKNTDAGFSSFYLYKKPGGKLYFGPPWDFDGTTTAARGEENDPTGIYVAGTVGRYQGNTSSELFAELYKTEEFLALVKARWKELSPGIKEYFDGLFTDAFYEENRYAAGRNFVRWQQSGFGRPSNVSQSQAERTWMSSCKTLKSWFDRRIAFLDGEWA